MIRLIVIIIENGAKNAYTVIPATFLFNFSKYNQLIQPKNLVKIQKKLKLFDIKPKHKFSSPSSKLWNNSLQ